MLLHFHCILQRAKIGKQPPVANTIGAIRVWPTPPDKSWAVDFAATAAQG
jgi:hypothetical protein